jgi:hypothetical protein
MMQQPDDEDRRSFSQALVRVLCGVFTLEEIREEMRRGGGHLDVRYVELSKPPGDRFIVFVRKTGAVYDHFDYYGDDVSDEEFEALYEGKEPTEAPLHPSLNEACGGGPVGGAMQVEQCNRSAPVGSRIERRAARRGRP